MARLTITLDVDDVSLGEIKDFVKHIEKTYEFYRKDLIKRYMAVLLEVEDEKLAYQRVHKDLSSLLEDINTHLSKLEFKKEACPDLFLDVEEQFITEYKKSRTETLKRLAILRKMYSQDFDSYPVWD